MFSDAAWTQPEILRAIFGVVAAFVGLATAGVAIYGVLHGLRVYRDQKRRENDESARRNDATEREGRLKGFELFQQMQSRYRQDPSIQAVFRSLYPGHYGGEKQPPATIKDKLDFMGFYEELAIMVNSGILRDDAAYYTFGIDAVEFYNKASEWQTDPVWKLFNSFAQNAQAFQDHSLENLDVTKLKYQVY
jgi:hypothetical protein